MADRLDRLIWNSLEPEWRAKAAAGAYNEDMPSLRRLYIDITTEREQEKAYWDAMCGVRTVENKFTQEPEESSLVFD